MQEALSGNYPGDGIDKYTPEPYHPVPGTLSPGPPITPNRGHANSKYVVYSRALCHVV